MNKEITLWILKVYNLFCEFKTIWNRYLQEIHHWCKCSIDWLLVAYRKRMKVRDRGRVCVGWGAEVMWWHHLKQVSWKCCPVLTSKCVRNFLLFFLLLSIFSKQPVFSNNWPLPSSPVYKWWRPVTWQPPCWTDYQLWCWLKPRRVSFKKLDKV